jgi:glucose-1-phosphatase
MEKGIKNIVFDLGGVIVDLDMHSCIDAFRALGVKDISNFVGVSRQEDLFHDFEIGTIDTSAFCREVRMLSQSEITDGEICTAWNKMLVGIKQPKKERLLELREGYMTYLLSNTNEIHWKKACEELFPYHGFEADNYFEQIFLSFEMHCAKPGDTIFEMMLRQAGIKAEETLFVDDSAANCETARRLGIKTRCVRPDEDWTIYT